MGVAVVTASSPSCPLRGIFGGEESRTLRGEHVLVCPHSAGSQQPVSPARPRCPSRRPSDRLGSEMPSLCRVLLCRWPWQTPPRPLAWLLGCFASCATHNAGVFCVVKSVLFAVLLFCLGDQLYCTAVGRRLCRILREVPRLSLCAGVTAAPDCSFGSVGTSLC